MITSRPGVKPPPLPVPRPGAPKTLSEHIEHLTGLAETTAHRAELALRSADRAEDAAIRTETAVRELARTTPDAQGRPGVLYWMGSELAAMRKAAQPAARARSLAYTFATAAFAGALGALLTTCAHR